MIRCLLGLHRTAIVEDGTTGRILCKDCGHPQGDPWPLLRPEQIRREREIAEEADRRATELAAQATAKAEADQFWRWSAERKRANNVLPMRGRG